MSATLEQQARLWRRRPRLDCGCTDPCRCDYRDNPTEKRAQAYRETIEHLDRHGMLAAALLPELRMLWHHGGADRDVAESLMRRWSA